MQGLVEGKAGFVTGAAGGIGRGIAIELAREGASVVVGDLDSRRDAAEETVRLIRESGGSAIYCPVDVTIAAEVDVLAGAVRESFGHIDYAVNNAGVGPHNLIGDITDAEFDRTLAVNLKGVLYGMQSAARAFSDQGISGAIVNISSVAGVTAIPGIGSYTASKHAVNGITKVAAREYGEQGVRVNAILPNGIRTSLATSIPNIDDFFAQLISHQSIKREGEPFDVGYAAAFLISDRASFLTGITLPVDGGYLAGA